MRSSKKTRDIGIGVPIEEFEWKDHFKWMVSNDVSRGSIWASFGSADGRRTQCYFLITGIPKETAARRHGAIATLVAFDQQPTVGIFDHVSITHIPGNLPDSVGLLAGFDKTGSANHPFGLNVMILHNALPWTPPTHWKPR